MEPGHSLGRLRPLWADTSSTSATLSQPLVLCCPEPVTPAVEQVSRPAPHACAAGPPGLAPAPQHPAAARSLGAGRGCLQTAQVSSSLLSLVFSGQNPLQMRHSSDPSVHLTGRASAGTGCWPTGPARCSGQCLCLWVACAASVWPGCCSGSGRPGSLTPAPPSPAPGTRALPPLGAFSESAGGGGRPGPEGPP